jgi:fatty acid desaturase
MANFLYAILVIGVGWIIGSTLFGAVVFFKLKDHVVGKMRRRYFNMAMAKLAFCVLSGILLYRIVQLGTALPSIISYIYAIWTFVGGYFFTAVALSGIDELADYEIEEADQSSEMKQVMAGSSHDRFTRLEDRVTAEETRNTDIEEVARQAREREDKRESEEG